MLHTAFDGDKGCIKAGGGPRGPLTTLRHPPLEAAQHPDSSWHGSMSLHLLTSCSVHAHSMVSYRVSCLRKHNIATFVVAAPPSTQLAPELLAAKQCTHETTDRNPRI